MREIHRREMRAQSYRSKSPMDRDVTVNTQGREEKRFVFLVTLPTGRQVCGKVNSGYRFLLRKKYNRNADDAD